MTLALWFRLLKSPAPGSDSLILGIGVRGSVLNMGIVVSSQCASECGSLSPWDSRHDNYI